MSHASTTFTVTGMTCGHCVSSVREEVGGVSGVTAVDVDLASGTLSVSGSADADDVRAAVRQAGYEVIG